MEQLTFNQWVAGSNPARLTTNIKGLAEITLSLLFFQPDIQPDKYPLIYVAYLFTMLFSILSFKRSHNSIALSARASAFVFWVSSNIHY